MNKSKIIAFSGSCFSGKTTAMKAFKQHFEKKGYSVIVLNELIREVTNKPIDELRKDANEYFEVQRHIISEKIKQEKVAATSKDTIVLVDRAITDSLYYFEKYINANDLSQRNILEYIEMQVEIIRHIREAFSSIYSLVIEFSPISLPSKNSDAYRPKNIDFIKHIEYIGISRLNSIYSINTFNKMLYFDGNVNTTDELIQTVSKKLEL